MIGLELGKRLLEFGTRLGLAIRAAGCRPLEPRQRLIQFVKDRPGHDRRYAIDATKLERELGWKPKETFDTGIQKTVEWYLANQSWVDHVVSGDYKNWIEKQYA